MIRPSEIDLETAFRAAHFRVICIERDFIRHIARIDHTADAAFSAAGCNSHWAILTPCNPGARKLPDADNAARLIELRQQLDARHLRYLPSINSAADGRWPEPGFCILDAESTLIRQLARQCEQVAYVSGSLAQAPQLVWTR